MPSFPEASDNIDTRMIEAAARVCPHPVTGIERGGRGGNSRLYKVFTTGAPLALKAYPLCDDDPRDRLGTEFRALRFLREHGVDAVPKAFAIDREHGVALYEWIDGSPPGKAGEDEIRQAIWFLGAVFGASHALEGRSFAPASEACLSGLELVRQIEHRIQRLAPVAREHAGLPGLLTSIGDFAEEAEAAARTIYRQAGMSFDADLGPELQRLSPSDFGFHNALRRPDGTIVFLDMEYFGRDDPAKLACDTILHPAMRWHDGCRRTFIDAFAALVPDDLGFLPRARALHPLYALRWCLIVLNEFLPERWKRRMFAGATGLDMARAEQLEKAHAFLKIARRSTGDFPDEK